MPDRRRRDPTWGSRTAPVTIVEFADFQCPFCARAEPTLARMRRDVRAGQAPHRLEEQPARRSTPNARPAAEAAAGVRALAGDDAFWRFLDLAFHHPERPRAKTPTSRGRRRRACATPTGSGRGLRSARVGGEGRRRPRRGARARRQRHAHVLRERHLRRGRASRSTRSRRSSTRRPSRPRRRSTARNAARARLRGPVEGEPRRAAARSRRRRRAGGHEDGLQGARRRRAPRAGPAGALVTIVEFADFQCPFCVRAEATLRDAPRGRTATSCASSSRTSRCPFHPARRARRRGGARGPRREGRRGVLVDARRDARRRRTTSTTRRSSQLAVTAGARADKVQAAITKHTHAAEIDADADTADDFQANGTPHFFINGRRLVGRAAQGAVRRDHRRGDSRRRRR